MNKFPENGMCDDMTARSFQYFQLKKTCTMQELRDRFKKLAFRAHPDRGGTSAEFNAVKEYYQCIVTYIHLRDKKTIPLDSALSHVLEERDQYIPSESSVTVLTKENFHDEFEKSRILDAYAYGYGDYMDKSDYTKVGNRVPTYESKVQSGTPSAIPHDRTLTVFQEPKEYVSSMGYMLGQSSIADFGKDPRDSSGLGFTDYRVAFSGDLHGTTEDKRRQNMTFEEKKKEREMQNTSCDATKEEQLQQQKKREEEKRQEMAQLRALKEYDEKVKANYKRYIC